MQVGLEQYFKVVTVKYINIYSIAFGLQMLLDNEVCFKKVFITFFTVPDVCGDVGTTWLWMGMGLQILNKFGMCIGRVEWTF